jgi:hypothetical protein
LATATLWIVAYVAVTTYAQYHHPLKIADAAQYTVPSSIPDDCSQDNTSDLETWINSLGPDATVNFPSHGCYLIQGQLELQNMSGLTINGNETLLERTDPTAISTSNLLPVLRLNNDSGLTVNNLDIDGGYDGTYYGGPSFEGHSGIQLQGDQQVVLNGLNVANIQGDFIVLQVGGNALNTNILVTNSNFNHAGYHGITVESANGVTFSNNTFSNVAVDAMDFEYDIYSTVLDTNGNATGAAEDNVSIINNTWTNCHFIWFASIQGQKPGVQEQNIVLAGNTITTREPFVQVSGTDESATAQPYWFNGLTIQNNNYVNGAVAAPTSGGTPGKAFVDSSMNIKNVSNVNISNNNAHVSAAAQQTKPFLGALSAHTVTGLTLSTNDFTGALGVINPDTSSGSTGVTECNNQIGIPGAVQDGNCSSAPCPVGQIGTPPDCLPMAPNAPATITANAAGANRVNLSWTPGSAAGGPSIAGYYILRSDPANPASVVGQVGGVATAYADTSVSPRTTYTYSVEAYDSTQPAKVSLATNTASATTPADSSPLPSTPSGIGASPVSQSQISLSWAPSTDVGGPGIGGYYILRNGQIVGSSTTTSYQDLTTSPLTAYSYTIEAYDSSAEPNVSLPSTPIDTTTPVNPSKPSKLNATVASPTEVDLSWAASTDTNGPGLAGYYILRDGNQIGQVDANSTTFADTGVSALTSYSYRIEAFDSANPVNVSVPSAIATVTTVSGVTYPTPGTPSGLAATPAANGTTVKLTWTASTDTNGPGIAGYNIYRDGVQIDSVNAPTVKYNDGQASPGTTYSYSVQAFDSNNPTDLSALSQPASATTPNTSTVVVPSTPQSVGATVVSANEVDLNWAASADHHGPGVAGYYILRNGFVIDSTDQTTITYADTTVSPSTTYSYTIEAFDQDDPPNVSNQSSPVSATTPASQGPVTPTVPSGLHATASSVTQIDLSWGASTDTGGPGVGGYYVVRDGNQIASVDAATTFYQDKTVAADTAYSYTIEAFDRDDPPNVSADSIAANATTPVVVSPNAPTVPGTLTGL